MKESLMAGRVYDYLENDHRRLEEALNRATRNSPDVEPTSYLEFRAGLLRHIGMEEKILFPLAQAAPAGEALPAIHRLHLDHGALAALLV
jgi:iron-sulfur cluster repair protein YtfE (RIC family)